MVLQGLTIVSQWLTMVIYNDDAIQVVVAIITCSSHNSLLSMHISLLHNPFLTMPIR